MVTIHAVFWRFVCVCLLVFFNFGEQVGSP